MRISLLLCLLFLFVQKGFSQEFQASVSISTPKLQTADPKIFKTLKNDLTDFINRRAWTEDVYSEEERIELSIQIFVDEEVSNKDFKGQLLIQATRPVLNSNYNSVIFEHRDKDFDFEYREFETLDFSENVFTSNMTSTLAFYIYTILGLDYDSFGELGGTPHLQKAQLIVNSIPQNVSDNYPGWKSFGRNSNRNRYALVDNLLNARSLPLRRALYKYHLGGLDLLHDNLAAAQQNIKAALDDIAKVNKDLPNSMIIQVFVNSKREEIINVFSGFDQKTKRDVFNMMVKMDAPNAAKYKPLIQS